jgi:hypothetical protein
MLLTIAPSNFFLKIIENDILIQIYHLLMRELFPLTWLKFCNIYYVFEFIFFQCLLLRHIICILFLQFFFYEFRIYYFLCFQWKWNWIYLDIKWHMWRRFYLFFLVLIDLFHFLYTIQLFLWFFCYFFFDLFLIFLLNYFFRLCYLHFLSL